MLFVLLLTLSAALRVRRSCWMIEMDLTGPCLQRTRQKTAEDCAAACLTDNDCNFASFRFDGDCFLRASRLAERPTRGVVSIDIACVTTPLRAPMEERIRYPVPPGRRVRGQSHVLPHIQNPSEETAATTSSTTAATTTTTTTAATTTTTTTTATTTTTTTVTTTTTIQPRWWLQSSNQAVLLAAIVVAASSLALALVVYCCCWQRGPG